MSSTDYQQFRKNKDNKKSSSFRNDTEVESTTTTSTHTYSYSSRKELNLLTDLSLLDNELIQLIAKRTHMISKLPKTGTIAYEKQLRISWEKNATTISKDSLFIKDFFSLLQEIELSSETIEQISAFCLNPKIKPINVILPLPSCFRTTQLYMALATFSRTEYVLEHVLLNDPVIECLKALNQIGASFRWEKPDYIIYKQPAVEKRTSSPIDTVIHVGNDPLSLYLVVFLTVIRQARIKFIGKTSLKLANFASLRHFLPTLGARLINVIPGQEGLPIRVESPALLPSEVIIPENLHPDAVIALFMSTPGWDKKVTIVLEHHPKSHDIANEVIPLLNSCNIKTNVFTSGIATSSICVTPGEVTLPKQITMNTYSIGAATLLALPAFVGGSMVLKKSPGQITTTLKPVNDLLTNFGLEVTDSLETVNSRYLEKHICKPLCNDFLNVPDTLFPLAFTLYLIHIIKEKKDTLLPLPNDIDLITIDSFLAQLGIVRTDSKLKGTTPLQIPWTSPSANWGMAFSLAAFLRPQLKLNNPGCIEALFPNYWKYYNNIHRLDDSTQCTQKISEKNIDHDLIQTPSRRRIIAEL